MTNTVSKKINSGILTLCAAVGASTRPQLVVNRPAEGARAQNCFFNVAEVCERHGGQIVTGWLIWTWPDVLTEAIHHAVWQSPAGRYVDVTPHAGNPKRVMFAADPVATFDFTQATRRPNRFQALSTASNVVAFAERANLYFAYLALLSPEQLAAIADGGNPEHDRLVEDHLARLHALWTSHLKPADRCLCGSGRKFFRCCQVVPPLDQFLRSQRARASWLIDRGDRARQSPVTTSAGPMFSPRYQSLSAV